MDSSKLCVVGVGGKMKINNKEGRFGKLKLVVSPSHPELGNQVAKRLGIKPLEFELGFFPDGELKVRRLGDVSGCDICILSSLHSRYDTLKELRLICRKIQGYGSR